MTGGLCSGLDWIEPDSWNKSFLSISVKDVEQVKVLKEVTLPNDNQLRLSVENTEQICVRLANVEYIISQLNSETGCQEIFSPQTRRELIVQYGQCKKDLIVKAATFIYNVFVEGIILKYLYNNIDKRKDEDLNSLQTNRESFKRVFFLVDSMVGLDTQVSIYKAIIGFAVNCNVV